MLVIFRYAFVAMCCEYFTDSNLLSTESDGVQFWMLYRGRMYLHLQLEELPLKPVLRGQIHLRDLVLRNPVG